MSWFSQWHHSLSADSVTTTQFWPIFQCRQLHLYSVVRNAATRLVHGLDRRAYNSRHHYNRTLHQQRHWFAFTAEVDYCNSVLASVPERVTREVAMGSEHCITLITGIKMHERGLSQLLRDGLHWLTIPQRVQYKLAVTVNRCLRYRAPKYLADCCVPVSEVSHPPTSPFGQPSQTANWVFRGFIAAHLAPRLSQSPV